MKLIWSYEHDAWWRPHGWGYTDHIGEAGIYSDEDAARIVTRANQHLRPPLVNEMAIAPDALDEELRFWMGFRRKLPQLLALLETQTQLTHEIAESAGRDDTKALAVLQLVQRLRVQLAGLGLGEPHAALDD